MTEASEAAANAPQPMPANARNRALWQGALGVLCGLPVVVALTWLLDLMDWDGGWSSLLVFVVGLGALIYGVWKLGQARDRRWDGRGIAALLLMIAGWPLLLIFIGWTVIGLYVLITGDHFSPYGK